MSQEEMIRFNIFIPEDLARSMTQLAKALGISENDWVQEKLQTAIDKANQKSAIRTMKCLVCGKELPFNSCDAPNDGTIWTTTGNFGSAVYDELSESTFLMAVICDVCLKGRNDQVIERHRVFTRPAYRDTVPDL